MAIRLSELGDRIFQLTTHLDEIAFGVNLVVGQEGLNPLRPADWCDLVQIDG